MVARPKQESPQMRGEERGERDMVPLHCPPLPIYPVGRSKRRGVVPPPVCLPWAGGLGSRNASIPSITLALRATGHDGPEDWMDAMI